MIIIIIYITEDIQDTAIKKKKHEIQKGRKLGMKEDVNGKCKPKMTICCGIMLHCYAFYYQKTMQTKFIGINIL